MNANVTQEFKRIFYKHFNFKDTKVQWADFESDWNKGLLVHADQISSEEKDFLKVVFEEVFDISNHMPGKNGKSSELDWNRWTSDDDYLTFLLSREALLFPMSKEGYKKAVEGVVKSGLFSRPFKDEGKLLIELHKYLAKFLTTEQNRKYRVVKVIDKYPSGSIFQTLESGLSIEQAINLSVGYMTSDGIPGENIYFEEDI